MKLDELRGEGWQRLLAAARRRLETNGGSLDTTISIGAPTDAERKVIIGITGSHRSARAGRLRVPLKEIELFLLNAFGRDLLSILSDVDGQPVRDRRAERATEDAGRAAVLALASAGRHADAPWYQDWLARITSDGTLTRLVRRGGAELAQAVAVLDALPGDGLPLPVLSERATGDTKALAGTPLAGLVLRALSGWFDLPANTAEQQRTLWDAAGVIVDDLASQVLALNLPATGGLVASWLTSAAGAGIPFRLTLQQLHLSPVIPVAAEIFVCENPAVLRAAAATHGARCAPLICTEGVGSVACRRLVEAALGAGAKVLWRNDFDWPGLRMTGAAIDQFGVQPWRMSAYDYRAAVTPDGTPLRGATAPSAWDPQLAVAMSASGTAVMEERLLPALLADLGAAGPRVTPAVPGQPTPGRAREAGQ